MSHKGALIAKPQSTESLQRCPCSPRASLGSLHPNHPESLFKSAGPWAALDTWKLKPCAGRVLMPNSRWLLHTNLCEPSLHPPLGQGIQVAWSSPAQPLRFPSVSITESSKEQSSRACGKSALCVLSLLWCAGAEAPCSVPLYSWPLSNSHNYVIPCSLREMFFSFQVSFVAVWN